MHRDSYGYGVYEETKLLLMVFSPILLILLILLGVKIMDEMDKEEEQSQDQVSIIIQNR